METAVGLGIAFNGRKLGKQLAEAISDSGPQEEAILDIMKKAPDGSNVTRFTQHAEKHRQSPSFARGEGEPGPGTGSPAPGQ
jgi:hypothetical protein